MFALVALALIAPADVEDLEVGKRCRLKEDVAFVIRGTEVETTLARGRTVKITHLGETMCRVVDDGEEGLVPTSQLVEACAPEHERCWVKASFELTGVEVIDGKKKVYRAKPGTEIRILERRERTTRVLVGSTEAEAATKYVEERCGQDLKSSGTTVSDPLIDAMGPLPENTRVAILPIAHDGKVAEGTLDYFEAQLHRALAARLPDIAVAPTGSAAYDERARPAKILVENARRFPEAMSVRFAVVAHLTETGADRFTMTVALFDRDGVRRAALRARPTYKTDDPWASEIARQLDAKMKTSAPKKKR